jgi:predicted amidohydrolase YtcJ
MFVVGPNSAITLSHASNRPAATLAACTAENPEPVTASSSDAADLVLTNGRIYTVDEGRSWAEAIAISGERIVYVGDAAGVEGFKGEATTVVDLGGRLVLPGFQDVHIHPISGGVEASACDLNSLDTIGEYRTRIAECAQANPDLPWITGGGWSMAAFGPGARASKGILDELVPDRPVLLYSRDGHSAWANSRAFEIAGITKDTPDPADGIIDRDPETGEPVGSLQEGAASLVAEHVPETRRKRWCRGSNTRGTCCTNTASPRYRRPTRTSPTSRRTPAWMPPGT